MNRVLYAVVMLAVVGNCWGCCEPRSKELPISSCLRNDSACEALRKANSNAATLMEDIRHSHQFQQFAEYAAGFVGNASRFIICEETSYNRGFDPKFGLGRLRDQDIQTLFVVLFANERSIGYISNAQILGDEIKSHRLADGIVAGMWSVRQADEERAWWMEQRRARLMQSQDALEAMTDIDEYGIKSVDIRASWDAGIFSTMVLYDGTGAQTLVGVNLRRGDWAPVIALIQQVRAGISMESQE